MKRVVTDCPCCGARYIAELARLNRARDLARGAK